jgi:hypothetical protein
MARPTRKQQIEKERKERIPLGTIRRKLSVPDGLIPPNKVGRWVNDLPGRIQQALDGGYNFIEDPLAKVGDGPENQRDPLATKVSRVMDRETGMKGYLMAISKKLYDQDQKEKNRQLDEIDADIKRGNVEGQVGQDGRYIPSSGISITTKVQ